MSKTVVISIGELNVQSGSGYKAVLERSFVQPPVNISRVRLDDDAPVATQVSPGVAQYTLQVLVETAGTDADTVDARRQALLRALDGSRGPVTVTIENAAGTARRRYMNCVIVAIEQMAGTVGDGFAATLEPADQARWRATTTVEETWTLDATGTRSINVAGSLDAYPTYIITPNSAKAAPNWAYYRRAVIHWRSAFGGLHPIDITGGGLDTAALVTAGKVTDGSNIGVTVNGRYVPFWYGGDDGETGGFNSTTTRIWVNIQFAPETWATLVGHVSPTATTWQVEDDDGLPPAGVLLVEDEYILYTSRAPGYLYGVQRGQYGSSAAFHSPGEGLDLVHVVYILYGPQGEVPQTHQTPGYLSGNGRPVFLNGDSTNTEWRFENFHDYGAGANWLWLAGTGNLSFVSESAPDGTHSASWGYPWTAMGFKPGWLMFNRFYNRFALPIKTIRVLGRRRAIRSPLEYPGAPLLMVSGDGEEQWGVAWNAGTGAPRLYNLTFDVTSEEFPYQAGSEPNGHPGYNRVQWQIGQSNHMQTDIQTMIVTFWPSAAPAIVLSGELSDYDINAYIHNQTTGESITVTMHDLEPGKSLIIDSWNQTVTYSKDGSNRYSAVRRDAPRPRFLRLAPGTNNFLITESGMGNLTIVVRYEPRSYT